MTKAKSRILGLSIAYSAAVTTFLLLLLTSYTPLVFSLANDSFAANVTVSNTAPTVSNVLFNDSDAGNVNISLGAAEDYNYIMCNATITDPNGFQDVTTPPGHVNATFYHVSSSPTASDNKNLHYTNTSCTFTGGSGTTVTAVCTTYFEHEALNGTWTCNITAVDAAGGIGSAANSNYVEQLVALTVLETNISFGNLNNLQNSSTAQETNITNQGNVKIDVQVKANGDMDCSLQGSIGAGNISYSTIPGNYDSMYQNGAGNSLSTEYQTISTFNLAPEGITPFLQDQPATNKTYWTIQIPLNVKGECNNTLTVAAIISAD